MRRILSFLVLTTTGLLGTNWLLARNPAPAASSAPRPAEPAARILYPAGAQTAIALPDGGRERIHSLLNVERAMRFGDFVWDEENVPEGPLWVRVDLAAQTLSVFRAGHEIGTAVILYGTDGHPTPTGRFHVLEKDEDRWSRTYDAPMPYMLRLTDDGVAIHASDVVKGYATHGCIGVPKGFARRLFERMEQGDMVVIVAAAGQDAGRNKS